MPFAALMASVFAAFAPFIDLGDTAFQRWANGWDLRGM
jgi:hypothetical protein